MNTSRPIHHPIMTPLKALWRWLMAQPGQAASQQSPGRECISTPIGTRANTLRTQVLQVQAASDARPAPYIPVRVLQVMDGGQTSAQVGRLRISGRMADVCAELDRMAAREALLG